MLENKSLDIVIGLVFIYTLYSLLATTIQEFVATIFAYRHRMLERGLEQMLDGKNYSYYWWDKVANIIRWLGIKITKKGSEIPEAKVFLQKKELDNSASGGYKRNKLDSKSVLFAAQVTNHPLFRRKAENSLFYKKPAYLESTAFSDILVDLFHTNKSLPILLKDIETEIETNKGINTDLRNILLLFLREANGDLKMFTGLLENWYDDTMDRVSGWYKRQTQRILFTIGLILAILFNINTLKIVKILAVDDKVRAALVANAEKFVEKKLREDSVKANQPAVESETAGKGVAPKKMDTIPVNGASNGVADKTLIAATDSLSPQVSKVGSDSFNFEGAKQKFERIKEFYNEDINDQNKLLGLGWGDFGFLTNYKAFKQDSMAYIKSQADSQGQRITCMPKRPEPPGFFHKAWFIICRIPENFIGFLITALAISLGAPFWFDLLNKLVKLRSAGHKPADSRDSSTPPAASKTALVNQRPDPTAKG